MDGNGLFFGPTLNSHLVLEGSLWSIIVCGVGVDALVVLVVFMMDGGGSNEGKFHSHHAMSCGG